MITIGGWSLFGALIVASKIQPFPTYIGEGPLIHLFIIMASTLKLYNNFALAFVTIGHILSTFISYKLQRESLFKLIIKLSSWESVGKSCGKVGDG